MMEFEDMKSVPIFKEKVMQIEAGKFYRTRDGKKAYIAHIRNDDVHTSQLAIGFVYGDANAMSWQLGGHLAFPREFGDDLVEEWREPAFRKIAIYWMSDGQLHMAYAGLFPPPGEFKARALVTLTEGVFE